VTTCALRAPRAAGQSSGARFGSVGRVGGVEAAELEAERADNPHDLLHGAKDSTFYRVTKIGARGENATVDTIYTGFALPTQIVAG
jgi:hypothetical protein